MKQNTLILKLLKLTMLTSELLVDGGIVYNQKISKESNLRTARRILNKMEVPYKQFPVFKQGSFRRFYYSKDANNYHQINDGLIEHDSITALFLIHIFRCSEKYSIDLEWCSPFDIYSKKSDGGVKFLKNEKHFYSIILESDTGTHDLSEIEEKIFEYQKEAHKKRPVFFIIATQKRKKDIERILPKKHFYCYCPQNISPITDLFTIRVKLSS